MASCSLDAAARTARLREWEALRSDALISEETTESGAVVVLQRSPETKRGLQALIEAEKDCCSFLRFRVSERDGQVIVEVTSATRD